MSEKKYPYIGDNGLGQIVLIYGKDSVFHISGRYKGEFNDEYNETGVKNITREYLTNTYGKCESKEHADFICKLAENNGFNVINDYSELKGRIWFVISCYRIEFFSNQHDTKLIHLPLPPKEKEMPEVKQVKPIYTKEMHERGEKPSVGSLVWWDDYSECYSECEVLINKPDVDGCIVLLMKDEYVFAKLEDIKPIPTIEDELVDYFEDVFASVRYGVEGNKFLARDLAEKYNITRKGGK